MGTAAGLKVDGNLKDFRNYCKIRTSMIMLDNQAAGRSAMTTLEIEATVRDKNQITIPRPVAERHNIEPGQRIVIVDTGADDEFVVRILRPTYAGVLTGMFGTTDANDAYVQAEREAWH